MLALGFGCIHKVCILHIANYSLRRVWALWGSVNSTFEPWPRVLEMTLRVDVHCDAEKLTRISTRCDLRCYYSYAYNLWGLPGGTNEECKGLFTAHELNWTGPPSYTTRSVVTCDNVTTIYFVLIGCSETRTVSSQHTYCNAAVHTGGVSELQFANSTLVDVLWTNT